MTEDKEIKHCKHGPEAQREPHGCPYQGDINDNPDPEYCTCCAECECDCVDAI